MGHLPEREICYMRRHIDFDKIGIKFLTFRFPENVISSAYLEYTASYFFARALNLLSNRIATIFDIIGLAGEPCGNLPSLVNNLDK